jgi:Tfp pilus assembly PilM family ATPase
MDTLGIDIGTTTVKYVRYRKKADRIVSQGEYRYRRGWEEIREILSTIKDKEGSNVALIVGITSVELFKKICSVPLLPEPEMKAEVDALVSKSMLVPLLDMNREYLILGEVEDRGTVKQDVLFLGAHKSFIDHVTGLFRKAGFRRLSVLTDVGFCYRSMTDCALEGAIAVVDVGGTQTGIYIIDSGRLLLTREIMTACETLKDAVVGVTALSPNEAEEHLWMNGFVEPAGDDLNLPLERLAAQIQRTFLVYSQKYPGRPVVKVWIAGRGAKIPELPERLTGLLGQNFEVLPSKAEVDQQYIPAYALATRSDRFPNLLPEEMKDTESQATVTKYARAAGIIILCGTVLFSIAGWARLRYLKATIDSRSALLSQKNRQLAGQSSGHQILPSQILSPLNEAGQKEISFVLFLKFLSNHLPSQVYLKSIEFDAVAPPGKESGDLAGDTVPTKGRASDRKLRAGIVHLRGYVVADDEEIEPVLIQVSANLEKSGFLRNVKVDQKEMKNVKGRMLMEFVASGECRGYEI